MATTKLGFSGRIAQRFQNTEITPLLALLGILLGVFAVLVTPREEEPQINVTFANVFIPFPGATASEVEHLISGPAEQVLSEIDGIKHVYSSSMPGMATLTVEYEVGEDRTQAIVRLYNKVASNQDWLPQNLGTGMPLIKPKGIDDVPVITVALWSEDPAVGAYELGAVAHALEAELKRVPDSRDVYTVGAANPVVHVELDPQALSAFQIDLVMLRNALIGSNYSDDAISVQSDNREIQVQTGRFLSSAEEVASLVVGTHNNQPVFLSDVANVVEKPDTPAEYVWFGTGAAWPETGSARGDFPAVTLAIAKKPGANAVELAQRVNQRIEQLKGVFIPDNIKLTVTRNYGETADDKAKKLITKLLFATLSVVLLVMIALGRREALVVGAAVIVTLAITLFASWAWGFTLNRVSLFALIFSIGILVDDAIVVVENIHRHLALGARNLVDAIPRAVDEVGGPTILATFTVIAALLPMAFVTGLMGPYMSPIPINASLGMLISLAVAFIFTPWMAMRFIRTDNVHHVKHGADAKSQRLFQRVIAPFLDEQKGYRRRWYLLGGILLLITLSLSLVVTKHVVLKMLPFDNKSEFQIVLDMPEGTPLEQTTLVLNEMGQYLADVPEITDYQVYAGTSSPIGFNGLVRQYYLRSGAHLGDIQVNLVGKDERDRKSHQIAGELRAPLQEIARRYQGNAKIVEVPPGPPVMSPLVAEIYGLDYTGQIEHARKVRAILESTDDIVDVDDSVEYPGPRVLVEVDRQKAAQLGVSQQTVSQALATVLRGEDMGYLHQSHRKYAVPIRVEYRLADKADLEQLLALKVRSQDGQHLVPLSEMVRSVDTTREHSIQHKDLLPVVYVTADMAGELDSPLYGMFDAVGQVDEQQLMQQFFVGQPNNPYEYSIKWDGEWQITYETFRDMGIAYSVGLLLIYLLVVAQFRSYVVPLVIMAPIPLTIIGILPGHALLGAQFTATSMIGMIALAGIIVRNSILLVDFVNEQVRDGIEFSTAVINASAVRAKPIVLTGLAAMAGAFFILDDPIFSGLAVSLIFGILVSTVLTLVVIPVVYYAVMLKRLDTLKSTD